MKYTVVFALVVFLCSLHAFGKTIEDVKALLTDPVLEALYSRTYYSILERSEPDGFFLESVNGAYSGMFPRTVGGLASLYEVTGETEKTRRHVDLVLKVARENKMNRCAHVIVRQTASVKPGEGVNSGADIAISRLDAPYMGCQYFRGAGKPLTAVYAYITAARGNHVFYMDLRPELDAAPVAECLLKGENLDDGWVKFAFDKPFTPEKGKRYLVTLQSRGGGSRSVWHGAADEGRDGEIYAVGSDDGGETWIHRKGLQMAFAPDYGGSVRIDRKPRYEILSRGDQADGNLHVLAAWAMVANTGKYKAWENRTYKQVAALLDTVMDRPYYAGRAPRVFPGLVKNHMFEHSREGRYWDCWDILTQSWALRTLELMQAAAERRGDKEHLDYWKSREKELLANVNGSLTFEVDGKKVYAEMRKADSSDGTFLEGMSWVNYGTIASQYSGFDPEILADTLEVYAKNALLDWHGHRVWAHEWNFNGSKGRQVIGKGVGWDLVWCMKTGNYDRACDWLEFVKDENYTNLYAEAFNLTADNKTRIQDDGNGEQCSWWCWGVAYARRACGLDPVPQKASDL